MATFRVVAGSNNLNRWSNLAKPGASACGLRSHDETALDVQRTQHYIAMASCRTYTQNRHRHGHAGMTHDHVQTPVQGSSRHQFARHDIIDEGSAKPGKVALALYILRNYQPKPNIQCSEDISPQMSNHPHMSWHQNYLFLDTGGIRVACPVSSSAGLSICILHLSAL